MKTIIVFKTHVDVGFTDLSANVMNKYTTTILSDAIAVCEQTQSLGESKQYVWTVPAWIMKAFDETGKIDDLTRRGQLAWHALPFTTHTEFCGLEEFIRGLVFSQNLSEKYGRYPVAAKMTDVPGHTWMLPSILNAAGVKFLHLGSNPSVSAPDVPRLFWWEGPDGARILVFYSKGEYGSTLTPPDDWHYPVWLALMHTGDNQGAQNADFIKEIFRDIESVSPETEAVIGTLDDFYNELVKHRLNIPVIKKDLADTWIHGTGTYPNETALLRDLRGRMTETEKLATIYTATEFFDEPESNRIKKHLSSAYEQCIVYGEHTWGVDVKTTIGHGRQYGKKGFLESKSKPCNIKAEQSWEEQRNRCRTAEKETRAVLDILAEKAGENILKFNGLGWERDGLPAFGSGVPEIEFKGRNTVKFKVKDGLIENDWFRIELCPSVSSIKSFIDKKTGKEWVFPEAPGFGYYQYDVYGDDDVTEFMKAYTYRFFDWSVNDLGRMGYPFHPHIVFPVVNTGEGSRIEGKAGELSSSLLIISKTHDLSHTEYGNAVEIKFTVTLYNDKPVIDIRYDLINKEESPMIEAGHFVFPLNLDYAKVILNKLGSVVDIETDIAYGANNALHCIDHFIDVTDGSNGMAFIPKHTHLVSVGEQNILKYKPAYEKTKPSLFFNAFNNSYGTNFPQWMGGDSLSFEFRLIPHKGDWKDGGIYKKAIEYRTPLIDAHAPVTQTAVGSATPATMQTASYASFFDLSEADGMEVLAFKQAEKGDGFILRLHDISGEEHECAIKFPKLFDKISRCDLQERVTEDIYIKKYKGEKYLFKTKPFQLHTFYLLK